MERVAAPGAIKNFVKEVVLRRFMEDIRCQYHFTTLSVTGIPEYARVYFTGLAVSASHTQWVCMVKSAAHNETRQISHVINTNMQLHQFHTYAPVLFDAHSGMRTLFVLPLHDGSLTSALYVQCEMLSIH